MLCLQLRIFLPWVWQKKESESACSAAHRRECVGESREGERVQVWLAAPMSESVSTAAKERGVQVLLLPREERERESQPVLLSLPSPLAT